MTVLDFTKKTTPVIDKLITTWENVMNGVILKIIDTYAVSYDENDVLYQTPTEYVRITDDCTNISVTMSVEEFIELERITNSNGSTFPRPETSFKRITNEN